MARFAATPPAPSVSAARAVHGHCPHGSPSQDESGRLVSCVFSIAEVWKL